jgi:uncharacterized RDD family membrane protein YckC
VTDPFAPASTPPPGWYHAEGDPAGTHRYWDGTRWQGGPQPIAGPVAGPAGAPLGPVGSAPPVGPPAGFGARFIAYLIDSAISFGIFVGGLVLSGIFGAASEGLGVLGVLATIVASFWFGVWNLVLRQGRTGQSLGKQNQGIALVADGTGRPVGAGMAVVRFAVGWALSAFTFGLLGLLDYLWPLWDQDKKRLTDKFLKLSVVRT